VVGYQKMENGMQRSRSALLLTIFLIPHIQFSLFTHFQFSLFAHFPNFANP